MSNSIITLTDENENKRVFRAQEIKGMEYIKGKNRTIINFYKGSDLSIIGDVTDEILVKMFEQEEK